MVLSAFHHCRLTFGQEAVAPSFACQCCSFEKRPSASNDQSRRRRRSGPQKKQKKDQKWARVAALHRSSLSFQLQPERRRLPPIAGGPPSQWPAGSSLIVICSSCSLPFFCPFASCSDDAMRESFRCFNVLITQTINKTIGHSFILSIAVRPGSDQRDLKQ